MVKLRSKKSLIYKGWQSYRVYKPYRCTMHWNEKKNTVFYSSLSIEQAYDECGISDRSRGTAGFIIRVVPTPTEHEFLRAVGVQMKCSTCELVTTRYDVDIFKKLILIRYNIFDNLYRYYFYRYFKNSVI